MNVPYIEKKQLTITIAIQFYSWILKEFLVMDFCSEYFSEIYLTLIISVKLYTRHFSKKISALFFH